MILTEAEQYKKFVDKARALQKNGKSKSRAMTSGLSGFVNHFAEIAGSLEVSGAAKAHMIGLSAFMANLKASESPLGIFSDPFIDIAEMLGSEIASLTLKTGGVSREKVIQWWLELSILIGVGMLTLAQEKKLNKETEILDPIFRDELLLSLVFRSGYPKMAFTSMAEAVGAQNEKLFISLFEGIVMVFVLAAYSNEREMIRQDLGESLAKKLLENIATIKEEVKNASLKAYLELAEMALDKGEIDQLAISLQDLMKTAGYSNELFQKDISAIKNLFRLLKTAYFASKENTMNMVHMVG